MAGWLRSRLKRDVKLTRRNAAAVRAVWVDGERVESRASRQVRVSCSRPSSTSSAGIAIYEEAVVRSQSNPASRRAIGHAPSERAAATVRLARPTPNVVIEPAPSGSARAG